MTSLQQLTVLDRRLSACLTIPPRARCLRLLALTFAHSGDSPLWLLGASGALIWGNTTWRSLGWRTVVGTLVAGAVITALKWIFRRQRPRGHWSGVRGHWSSVRGRWSCVRGGKGRGFYTRFDRHAFPSGHAGRSACLTVLLAPLLAPWGGALLALWTGLVGLARVALQVHFASDIAVGWAVGLLVGLVLQMAF
jgi:undecaprenyl-diphosphatase